MNWYVYLLISKNIKFLNYTYVGITTDLNRRIQQHNGKLSGGAKYTQSKRPYEIAHFIDNIANRSNASKLEYEIKQQKGYHNRLKFMESLKKLNNNETIQE